jgi:hypothetical protein
MATTEHIAATPRLDATTINAWIKKKCEPIYRKRIVFGMMKAKGRILMNVNENGAKALQWLPRFRRRDITPGDATPSTRTFTPTNVYKQASIPYRTYWMGETISKAERLMQQRSDSTLANLVTTLAGQMTEDFTDALCDEIYRDGYTSANSKRLIGLESMFGVNGCVSNSPVGDPNDSYAQLTTNLGTYGGDWTANSGKGWPTGTGDTEYCFWSPLVVDYTNTGWAATTKTWPNTWQEAVNYLITYGQTLQKTKYDLILVNTELMRQMKDSMNSKQTFEVTQGSDTLKAGFETVKFNGVEFWDEFGVPDAVGYGLNWSKMELRSLQSELIVTERDTDITTSSQLLAMDSWLGMRFESPAYFAKLQAIS